MRPVQHPVKLWGISHVTFECRQKDLRRIREDNNAQRDGKVLHIDRPSNFAQIPVTDFQQAISDDDEVDEEMRHRAPERENRDGVNRFQERQGQQEDSTEHHPWSESRTEHEKTSGRRQKLESHLESIEPSGKTPAIKSPQTTTYKMQVMTNSMIWAMLTMRAPIFFPKQALAMET